MPRLIVVSIVLLIVFSYAMFFASWNQQTVRIVGLRFGGQEYWQEVPAVYLPLAGVAIGVVAMAIATLLHWQGQKDAFRKLSAQVAKARQVIEQQKQRISELEGEVAQAREAAVPVEPVAVELEPPEEGKAVAGDTGEPAEENAAQAAPSAVDQDDEEII
jgi:uncharacterized coiled-coil protein SlyX